MALEHADEALHFLVDALASRPGSVQDRLRELLAIGRVRKAATENPPQSTSHHFFS